MTQIQEVVSPGSGFRLLLVLGVLFGLLCMLAALKSQLAPAMNDETLVALGMAVPTYGVALLILGGGAFFPYARKWRIAFLVPLALFGLSVMIASL